MVRQRNLAARSARALRRVGFTILEILIAIVVLVLGITGIVALFPTAIESGNQTVEDTYAATITQSVVDAIAVGLRESRYTITDNKDRVWTYFIFNHDGVQDRITAAPEVYDADQLWKQDYCILLPQGPTGPGGGNTNSAVEPFFIYPIPTLGGSPHLEGDQRALATLNNVVSGDDFRTKLDGFDATNFGRTANDGSSALWYTRVYHLGRFRESETIDESSTPYKKGDVRPEYRGEDLVSATSTTTTTTPGGEQSIALDPYPTYSFAFAIKRSRVDTAGATGGGPDGKIDVNDPFSNSLYELRVMIFKNFNEAEAAALTDATLPVPKTNIPIRTFITLISI